MTRPYAIVSYDFINQEVELNIVVHSVVHADASDPKANREMDKLRREIARKNQCEDTTLQKTDRGLEERNEDGELATLWMVLPVAEGLAGISDD